MFPGRVQGVVLRQYPFAEYQKCRQRNGLQIIGSLFLLLAEFLLQYLSDYRKPHVCFCLLLAGVFCVVFFSGACAGELLPMLKPQKNQRAVHDWKNAMRQ